MEERREEGVRGIRGVEDGVGMGVSSKMLRVCATSAVVIIGVGGGPSRPFFVTEGGSSRENSRRGRFRS